VNDLRMHLVKACEGLCLATIAAEISATYIGMLPVRLVACQGKQEEIYKIRRLPLGGFHVNPGSLFLTYPLFSLHASLEQLAPSIPNDSLHPFPASPQMQRKQ
jgi:hypothetical protein